MDDRIGRNPSCLIVIKESSDKVQNSFSLRVVSRILQTTDVRLMGTNCLVFVVLCTFARGNLLYPLNCRCGIRREFRTLIEKLKRTLGHANEAHLYGKFIKKLGSSKVMYLNSLMSNSLTLF